jgi:Spy/CpxP family protein refolding chaperone
MSWTSSAVRAAAALLIIGSVGCGASGGSQAAPATPAAAPSPEEEAISAGLNEHHRHHHYGGVTMFIALSLDTLGENTPERAAIEKIRADLHAKMEPARAAERSLQSLLADGIAAGGIDHAKADSMLASISAAAGASHDAAIGALNELHAALTPPERSALADKVEAHWEVWQSANAEEKRDATGRPRHEGHLERLENEIGLTQDQLDKIHATLAAVPPATYDPQKVAAHVKAFGDAFRADTFDAKTLTTASDANSALARFGSAQMVRFYEAVDLVLTADQRKKLSEILHEHASYDLAPAGGS